MIADGNLGVAAAAPAQKLLVVEFERPREPLDRLPGLLRREVQHPQLAHEQCVVGVPRHQLAEVADRRRVVVAFGGDQPPQFERRRMVGLAAEHTLEVGLGLVGVARLLVDAGPEHERNRVVGVDLDRLVEVGDRLRLFPLEGQHPGPLEQGPGGVRVDVDRLVERLLRLVELVLHHERHAQRLEERDVFGILLDGHLEVGPGLVEVVVEQVEQAARAPDVLVARGQFNRLVVVGAAGRLVVVTQVATDHVGLGDEQLVVAPEFDRLAGRLVGPLAVAPGQAFEAGDHQPRRAERRITVDRLVEVAHRELPHPRPLRVGGRAVENRLDHHAGAVHERARVQVARELLPLLVEALVDRLAAQVEDRAEVVEAIGRELGVDRGVEVGLTGLVGQAAASGQAEGEQKQ